MHLKSFGAHASGLRLERMKASPRYVDGVFVNSQRGAVAALFRSWAGLAQCHVVVVFRGAR